MPAKSKAQQRLMGMVYRYKKEGGKPPSKAVAKIAKSMSTKSAKDYASTPSKNLPSKKESLLRSREVLSFLEDTRADVPDLSTRLDEALDGLTKK